MRVLRMTIFHAKMMITLVFHQQFERLHPTRLSVAMLLALTLLPVRCSDVIMLRMPRSVCTFESDPWNACLIMRHAGTALRFRTQEPD
jgi:hypothetical protein